MDGAGTDGPDLSLINGPGTNEAVPTGGQLFLWAQQVSTWPKKVMTPGGQARPLNLLRGSLPKPPTLLPDEAFSS